MTRRNYNLMGLLIVVGIVLPTLAAILFALDCLEHVVWNRPPHPIIFILLLAFGLALAAMGQMLSKGRNEGIRTNGWKGVLEVIHIRLAYAGLAFLSVASKYAVTGRHTLNMYIQVYMAVPLTLSVLFIFSRMTKLYWRKKNKLRSHGVLHR